MSKRQESKSPLTSRLRKVGVAAAAAGLASVLAAGLSGCDTVAVLSFSERSFQNIHSSGFVPASSPSFPADGDASACGAVSDGEMKVRFVLTDNNSRPIRLGEAVDNFSVELDRDSVSFDADRSAVMQVSTSGACGDDSECTHSNYSCGLAPGTDDQPSSSSELDACYLAESNIGTDNPVNFVSDGTYHQVYGVLMQNSGSLAGWNPPGSPGQAWDSTGDGTADTPAQADLQLPEIATDRQIRRGSAISSVQQPWRLTSNVASEQGRNTYFGLWGFNGREGVLSYVDETTSSDLVWVRDPDDVSSAVSAYRTATANIRNRSQSNVYSAIYDVIDNHYTTSTIEEYVSANGHPEEVDKVLTIFVDGPDGLRDDVDVQIEDVIDLATRNNVRVFVIHLDPEIEDPSSLRPDPDYPEFQSDTCSGESDCRNYESCRRPNGYASSVGDDTEYGADDTYCVIDRDEQTGRIGPIQDYAQLACATGGGYMYVSSVNALSRNMEWTPYALEGLWEAPVSSRLLDLGHVPEAGEAAMLQTNMSVTVGGRSRSYPFSQLGRQSGTGSDSNVADFDTRGVVFSE
jgi:hypothetical protein